MFVEESSTILKKVLEKYADNMMYVEFVVHSSCLLILAPCMSISC
jgi:hypothetical protein